MLLLRQNRRLEMFKLPIEIPLPMFFGAMFFGARLYCSSESCVFTHIPVVYWGKLMCVAVYTLLCSTCIVSDSQESARLGATQHTGHVERLENHTAHRSCRETREPHSTQVMSRDSRTTQHTGHVERLENHTAHRSCRASVTWIFTH